MIRCKNCGALYPRPEGVLNAYRCRRCGISDFTPHPGDQPDFGLVGGLVGAIFGGLILGGSVGGPVGAIIGGLIGWLTARND